VREEESCGGAALRVEEDDDAVVMIEEDEGDIGDETKDPGEAMQGSALMLGAAAPPLDDDAELLDIQLSASLRL
jgi:hypothetical protein